MSTRSILARLALGAALVTTVASGLATASGAADGPVTARAALTDLLPAATNPTDGAEARFWGYPDGQGTTAILVVTGLSPASVGRTFGAHVHNGPCIHGAGPAAGPHFNIGGLADTEHEVWLDFTVRPGGIGISRTSVPFVIAHGAADSVVIHEQRTQVGGGAGPRMACLPVSF